ncbi:DUF2179 domain-containing protein [uncultured Lutibacter sp.]|uniref:DUF2179 domain-containing protein n=1 Tax=uncultured Lutibacter sp. TaxID=437739 RepID=UPI00260C8384|nr:DUF2179 domain-containing protein [uncultured Lutibacter sp.]
MDVTDFSFWFTYFILPLMIFFSRIIDVTLDTLRIVFVAKGNKFLAPLLGFFEILIWLIAITKIMQNLDNVACYIAYAAGFATGNYIGLIIEEKLAMGIQMFRIITQKDATPLIEKLINGGYKITSIVADGNKGSVHIIYLVVKRTENKNIISIINHFNPNAFYSIEDVRHVNEKDTGLNKKSKFKSLRWMRKGR